MLEEETADIGDWVRETELDLMVEQRIACEERGYPASEAQYLTTEEWEQDTGMEWLPYVAANL